MTSPLSRPPFPAVPTPDPGAWHVDGAALPILARLGTVLDRFFRAASILDRRSRNGSLPGWIADAAGPSPAAEDGGPAAFPPLPAPELVLTERGLRLSRLGRPFLGPNPETAPRDAQRHPVERDAWMAMFWSPSLRQVWSRELRESNRRFLEGLIPRCWMADPTPLPHQAVLPGLGSQTWAESPRRDLALRFDEPGGPEGPRELTPEQLSPEAWSRAVRDAETRTEGAATMLRERAPDRIETWDSLGIRREGTILLRPDYGRREGRIGLTGAVALLVATSGERKRGEAILGVAPCVWSVKDQIGIDPKSVLNPGA